MLDFEHKQTSGTTIARQVTKRSSKLHKPLSLLPLRPEIKVTLFVGISFVRDIGMYEGVYVVLFNVVLGSDVGVALDSRVLALRS